MIMASPTGSTVGPSSGPQKTTPASGSSRPAWSSRLSVLFFVVLMWVFAGFGLVNMALLVTRNQFDLNQSFTLLLLTPVFLTLALLLTALLFRGWNR